MKPAKIGKYYHGTLALEAFHAGPRRCTSTVDQRRCLVAMVYWEADFGFDLSRLQCVISCCHKPRRKRHHEVSITCTTVVCGWDAPTSCSYWSSLQWYRKGFAPNPIAIPQTIVCAGPIPLKTSSRLCNGVLCLTHARA